MPELTISLFIKTLKQYLLQHKSQEGAFNLLFDPIYKKIGSDNFSSKKISNIMNGKEAIPESVRRTLTNNCLFSDIKNNFDSIVFNNLIYDLEKDLKHEFLELVTNDNNISPEKKADLLKAIVDNEGNEDIANFLTEIFIYVANIPFKKHDVFRKVHYCSKAVNVNENDDELSALKQQYGPYVDLDKGNSNKDLILGKFYKITVKCSLESAFLRGNFMVNIEFEYAGIKYKAATSCNNWLSQSKMNNLLSAEISTLTLIFDVLNKDKGIAHIYLIGELDK